MSKSINSFNKVPKLVAFDLDGTLWYPDMYMLWGGGSPFKVSNNINSKELIDRNGNTVKLLGICSKLFDELKNESKWIDTKIAWVSCTDEPSWADECLRKFTTDNGVSLSTIVDSSHIYKANKQKHFQKLKSIYLNIEYNEMLFFDNEMGNIRSVSQLGVKCVYCPDGVTEDAWRQGLSLFN